MKGGKAGQTSIIVPRGSLRAPPGAPHGLDITTAGALSLAGHALATFALVGFVHLARLLTPPAPPPPLVASLAAPTTTEIELPELSRESLQLSDERRAEEAPAARPSGTDVAHPDMTRGGRGGDTTAREQALNFANQDDGITLDMSVLSNLERAQLTHILSGKLRRSWEDLRSSREPTELTFVAMGRTGLAEERRAEAPSDPARGLATAGRRSEVGALLGGGDPGEGDPSRRPGASTFGGPLRAVGLGFVGGARDGHQASALRNMLARPLVTQNDPMVDANAEGKPSDTEDTEQAVSARAQALLSASTIGGARGDGRGGTGGGGAPAAAGQKGAGATASTLGAGGVGPGDVERMGYVRAVHAKIFPFTKNAFPKWAALEGRGGAVTVTFTIAADGSISGLTTTRSSGIVEFDDAIKRAVTRAAPFGPLPRGLQPRLVFALPFTAPNPAVRPKHSGDGATAR